MDLTLKSEWSSNCTVQIPIFYLNPTELDFSFEHSTFKSMNDYYNELIILTLIMMALSAFGLYLITYSGVLWVSTKWRERTFYQKCVSIVGLGLFAAVLFGIFATAYSNFKPARTVVPGTYTFKKFDVSIAYPPAFTPTEFDTGGAEGDRNEMIAFVDSDGHYALVLAVSDLINIEVEKHDSGLIYGAPTSEMQKTINGKTFETASYAQKGEFPSRDFYYFQEDKLNVEAILNHDPGYDEETVTALRETVEKMLETLKVNGV